MGAAARITLHLGDITSDAQADAIVNAANTSLRATATALERHPGVSDARFWLFDQYTHAVFATALAACRELS